MFRDNILIPGGTPAPTLPSHLTLDEQLPIRLQDHLQRLRLILPVISVSVLALKRQHAELDEEIATVLLRHASDPLDVEIAKIEVLLDTLAAAQRDKTRQRGVYEVD
jgi:hypothetical protein